MKENIRTLFLSKITFIFLVLLAIPIVFLSVFKKNNKIQANTENDNVVQATVETTDVYETKCTTELETEPATTKNMLEEYKRKISEIQTNDMHKWFIEYRIISEDYSDYIVRDTIYTRFNKEELNLLFRIVEAEVTGNTYFINKANVASVIFNRLKDSNFPDDLTSILTYPYQFSTYASGRYLNVEITEATILACEFAYEIGDTTNGALFFDSKGEKSWAYNKLTLLTIDEVGHSFYK